MRLPDVWAHPARHAFVRLSPDWATHLSANLDSARRRLVADWVDDGNPLVVARKTMAEAADVVRLGLSLPDKTRIGLSLAGEAVAAVQPPPLLTDARKGAPREWTATIDAALHEARSCDVVLRVYGSLAWQIMTGRTYVQPRSDLDMLLVAARWEDAEALSRRLQALDSVPRLDGEVVLPDGSGIAWREIASASDVVLVKTPCDVVMRARADLARSYAACVA